MHWILDRHQKVSISPDSADIFWWTGPFSSQTSGIYGALLDWQHFFHHDLMLPIITKVVLIEKGVSQTNQSPEGRFLFIIYCQFFIIRPAEDMPIHNELMKMRIRPAHRNLDDLVQLRQCDL